MNKKRNDYLRWNRLDNTAYLFPVIARQGMSNVYRISAVLKEEIDEDVLNQALGSVIKFFDGFRCSIKSGFFWYYFEENKLPVPKAKPESYYPCAYINPHDNNKYLFRVTYYKNRINLEVFHALSDGSGAMVFLKELTYAYLRIMHPGEGLPTGDVPDRETSFDISDSYSQNYKNKQKKPYKTQKAITIKGEKLTYPELAVITGLIPVDQIKKAAKSYGVTINQYITGVYTWAIYTAYLNSEPSEHPVSVCVPVNLRPYFESDTNRNFFVMISADFKPDRALMSFEEVLSIVSESLKSQTTKENLERLFSYNVSNQKNMALRAVPLVLKKPVMKQVFNASVKATTTTVTNLGQVSVAEPYENHIERFQAMLAMSDYQNIKMAVMSYKNIMTISFTCRIKENDIQRTFFRKLAKDGIGLTIETNGVYYE